MVTDRPAAGHRQWIGRGRTVVLALAVVACTDTALPVPAVTTAGSVPPAVSIPPPAPLPPPPKPQPLAQRQPHQAAPNGGGPHRALDSPKSLREADAAPAASSTEETRGPAAGGANPGAANDAAPAEGTGTGPPVIVAAAVVPHEPIRILGLNRQATVALLGQPAAERQLATARVWDYWSPECRLAVYFYLDTGRNEFYALHYEINGAAARPDIGDRCLERIRHDALGR